MNTIVETITPAKAQEYLNTSIGNRSISKSSIETYADAMKAGKWKLNGVSIVFDTDGHLIDGHHRLLAIIKANIPVQTTVARGVEHEAFTTFDCGRHRTLGQILCMQEKKNYNAVASIIASSETLRVYGKIWANNTMSSKGRNRTNLEGYEIYMRDVDRFDTIADFSCEMYRRLNVLKISWIGGLYYHFITLGGYSEDTVKYFFEQLCSLSNSECKPIELLRSRLVKERIARKSIDTSLLFALVAKTWNAYITGKSITRLTYNEAIEEYPTLILNIYNK